MMMHHNTKFGNKMFVSLEDTIWTNIDILAFAVTLTLIAVIPFFSQNTLAVVLHHYTKSGNKMFCGSEDTIRTNIHCHF